MRDLQQTIANQPGSAAPSIPAHLAAATTNGLQKKNESFIVCDFKLRIIHWSMYCCFFLDQPKQPPPRPPPPVPAPRSTAPPVVPQLPPSNVGGVAPTPAAAAATAPPTHMPIQGPSPSMPYPISPQGMPMPQPYTPYPYATYPYQPVHGNYGHYPAPYPPPQGIILNVMLCFFLMDGWGGREGVSLYLSFQVFFL